MKQKQPRPPLRSVDTGVYTATSMSGGKPVYKTYTVETAFRELAFPNYVTSKGPDKQLQWNNMSGYSKLLRTNLPSIIPVGHKDNLNTKLHYCLQGQIPSTVRQEVINRAYNKVIAKMHSEAIEGKNQLMLTFAERQSTINMVASRVIQARNYVRAMKRGNVRKAWRILNGRRIPRSKKTAGLHLEVQYGWLQLTSELYNLTKQPGPIRSVTLRTPMSQVEHGDFKLGLDGDYEYGETTGSWSIKASYILKVEIELDQPLLASASQLGLTNPLFVAWDIIPYSLVVDWFLPIGAWLEQFETFKGLRVIRHQFSETVRTQMYVSDKHGAERSIRQKTKRRFNGDLTFSLKAKNPLSLMRSANAIAMIRQKFR